MGRPSPADRLRLVHHWRDTLCHVGLEPDDRRRHRSSSSGCIQGAGSGFINVPITTIAFATLPGELRTEATSFLQPDSAQYRGSAIGISVSRLSASQLVESTQINHSRLAEFMTPFRHMSLPRGPLGMHMLNLGITQQAAMIAFINIFWLLGILCIAIIPLVLLLRVPKGMSGEARQTPAVAANNRLDPAVDRNIGKACRGRSIPWRGPQLLTGHRHAHRNSAPRSDARRSPGWTEAGAVYPIRHGIDLRNMAIIPKDAELRLILDRQALPQQMR